MLRVNQIPLKLRLIELAIDYVCILVYLLLLLGLNSIVFLVMLDGFPALTEVQSQLVAAFTSVVPGIFIFSVWDYTKGSPGKRIAQLKLVYASKSISTTLLRNVIKFLPWQLAHVGVIHGMYKEFDRLALVFIYFGLGLGLSMLVMGLTRKDKRHLADFIAKTQVQMKQG